MSHSLTLPFPARSQALLASLRKNSVGRHAINKVFRWLQGIGISIVPRHFYWPVPDVNELAQRDWPVLAEAPGVNFNFAQQFEFLQASKAYQPELIFPKEPRQPGHEYHYNNGLFEAVDAEVAYLMVRQHRPQRIIEVGCGFSTRLLASAAERNRREHGIWCNLTCIDPHPDAVLLGGIPGVRALWPEQVQKVTPALFDTLQANDILFLDTSHVVATGSDVVHEVLNILPRLQTGVLVHIHDIFLPADYPRDMVVENLVFWSEQYIIQAFLAMNEHYRVVWGSSSMQLFCPDVLLEAFPSWRDSYAQMPKKVRTFIPTADGRRVWPSSFWIKRT